jgi:outer membrane protein OmpA-like peptidoglycan-associated protein
MKQLKAAEDVNLLLDKKTSDLERQVAAMNKDSTVKEDNNWLRDKGTDGKPWVIRGLIFVLDKSVLVSQANAELTTLLTYLIAHYDDWSELKIDGHTDSFGAADANRKIGMRRAEAVRDFFVANGLGAKKFILESFGEDKPLVPNTTPDGADDPNGRRENRRMEFYIIK